MKKLRITVEGKVYEVLVEVLDEPATASAPAASARPMSPVSAPAIPATPAAPTSAVAPPRVPVPAAAGDIVSPLAGKVVSIDVKPGHAVEEGAQVATVEAMKMNTYIYAPRAGTVAAVLVNAGDAVEEGAPMIRLG